MVSVDTVYQRVLVLANKEQRGYITPQEFNLLANLAQMSIFEQYFSEIDNYGSYAGNDTVYADPLIMTEEKLQIFENVDDAAVVSSYSISNVTDINLPDYIYRIDHLTIQGVETERLNVKDYKRAFNQPLTTPNTSRPIYYVRQNVLRANDGKKVDPTAKDFGIFYIKKPATVNWGYIITLGEAMYNASASRDFELHNSEQNLLVFKILELAGIVINKPGLVQMASKEEEEIIAQQKLKQ